MPSPSYTFTLLLLHNNKIHMKTYIQKQKTKIKKLSSFAMVNRTTNAGSRSVMLCMQKEVARFLSGTTRHPPLTSDSNNCGQKGDSSSTHWPSDPLTEHHLTTHTLLTRCTLNSSLPQTWPSCHGYGLGSRNVRHIDCSDGGRSGGVFRSALVSS